MSVMRSIAPYRVRRFIASALDDLRTLPARLSRAHGFSEPWSIQHNSGGGDYVSRGDGQWAHIHSMVGLEGDLHILEIGCGGGAIADALRRRWRADEGRYIGFDVARGAVAQCRRRFATLRPDFRFEWADLSNDDYAPEGGASAETYRFPCASGDADRIIAGSVFSHLSADASAHYFKEMSRCLAADGASFVSLYILDAAGRDAIRRGVARARFETPALGGWTHVPETPEASMAHEEAKVLKWLDAAGLRIVQRQHGSWREAGGSPTGQDILALKRA